MGPQHCQGDVPGTTLGVQGSVHCSEGLLAGVCCLQELLGDLDDDMLRGHLLPPEVAGGYLRDIVDLEAQVTENLGNQVVLSTEELGALILVKGAGKTARGYPLGVDVIEDPSLQILFLLGIGSGAVCDDLACQCFCVLQHDSKDLLYMMFSYENLIFIITQIYIKCKLGR